MTFERLGVLASPRGTGRAAVPGASLSPLGWSLAYLKMPGKLIVGWRVGQEMATSRRQVAQLALLLAAMHRCHCQQCLRCCEERTPLGLAAQGHTRERMCNAGQGAIKTAPAASDTRRTCGWAAKRGRTGVLSAVDESGGANIVQSIVRAFTYLKAQSRGYRGIAW